MARSNEKEIEDAVLESLNITPITLAQRGAELKLKGRAFQNLVAELKAQPLADILERRALAEFFDEDLPERKFVEEMASFYRSPEYDLLFTEEEFESWLFEISNGNALSVYELARFVDRKLYEGVIKKDGEIVFEGFIDDSLYETEFDYSVYIQEDNNE